MWLRTRVALGRPTATTDARGTCADGAVRRSEVLTSSGGRRRPSRIAPAAVISRRISVRFLAVTRSSVSDDFIYLFCLFESGVTDGLHSPITGYPSAVEIPRGPNANSVRRHGIAKATMASEISRSRADRENAQFPPTRARTSDSLIYPLVISVPRFE